MSGYLIVALPWFTGGLICLAVAGGSEAEDPQNTQPERRTLPPEFLFGLGGLLGCVAWGNALWVADQFGHTLLGSHSVVYLALLLALAALLIRKNSIRLQTAHKLRCLDRCFLLLLSALLGLALYLQHMTPLFAWDGLDHWAKNAGEFIPQTLIDEPAVFNRHYSNHPATVVMIAAWTGWSMQFTNTLGWGTPWLLCMISLCFMTAGFIRSLTGKLTSALLGGVLTATVPLAESHTLIAGYAELWLAAVVIAGLLLLGLGLEYQRRSWILTGVLVGGLAIAIKNNGPGYALCVWGALVFSWLTYRPKIATLVLLSLGAVAYGLCAKGFLVDWAGIKIQWNPDTQNLFFAIRDKLFFTGRLSTDVIFPFEGVVINELYSLFANQSFSTAVLALLFGVVAICCPSRTTLHQLIPLTDNGGAGSSSIGKIGVQPLIIGALLILSMLILSQLFLPYSYNHGLPGSDTGNSRFSLPFILAAIPAAIVMAHTIMKKPRRRVALYPS